MPHATLPATGFQAFILCGPGESLAPFNANPSEFPKALIPIANRPMVWYPLDWCYRAGITNITLVAPPTLQSALDTALNVNPHLTSLPSPRPTLLAPKDATLTTGTAELFRHPEIQAAITGDFVVLPCDLVCELSGTSLLETWMTMQGGLGGSSAGEGTDIVAQGYGGERNGRRGGLGVWYQTKDATEGGVGVKKEETDFLATTELSHTPARSVPPPPGSLRGNVHNLVMAMPTAALHDELEDNKALRIRQALLRKHGRVRMLMSHRDAHVYFFPYWVKEMLRLNDTFESVGEDLLGWWAKAGWQEGLVEKLGLSDILAPEKGAVKNREDQGGSDLTDEIDLAGLSSTWTSRLKLQEDMGGKDGSARSGNQNGSSIFASRVTNPPGATVSPVPPSKHTTPTIPPIYSYLHPSHPPATLLRRVDTVPLLLSVSLALAKLPALSDLSPSTASTATPTAPSSSDPSFTDATSNAASAFAHAHKIHPTSLPLPPQLTLPRENNLIDANVQLAPRSTIRECVVGDGCVLGAPPPRPTSSSGPEPPTSPPRSTAASAQSTSAAAKDSSKVPGVRLHRTLLMSQCVVEPGAKLTGCVLGRRCVVGANAELTDCYVQEGFVVPAGTVAKGEVLAVGVDEGEGGDLGLYEDEDGEEDDDDMNGDGEEDDEL